METHHGSSNWFGSLSLNTTGDIFLLCDAEMAPCLFWAISFRGWPIVVILRPFPTQTSCPTSEYVIAGGLSQFNASWARRMCPLSGSFSFGADRFFSLRSLV